MMSVKLMFVFVFTVLSSRALVSISSGYSEPSEYILSFPRGDNPLNISVVEPLSRNYIITIGDWGSASTAHDAIKVQKQVASLLQDFYTSQKSKGYNLLFIASVGDNFYWTGQNCVDEFEQHWSDIYGPDLTANEDVPWLAVYGNHDWGNSDPYAVCAWNNTKFYNETTKIPYAANQVNQDKGGCNPSTYYLPDFSYYYSISDRLQFEIIALETTSYFCPDELGTCTRVYVYTCCLCLFFVFDCNLWCHFCVCLR